MSFLISIPIPPSVNSLFANRTRRARAAAMPGRRKQFGRVKTKRYRAWIQAAGLEVMIQRPKPVHGPYRLNLTLSPSNGDPGNRLKATEDLLVSMGLVDDDSLLADCRILIALEVPKGIAVISVEAA